MSTPVPLVPIEMAKICRFEHGKRTCIEIKKPVIFSQRGCVYCSEMKGKLQSLGIPFKDIDVTNSPKNFGLMMQVSGQSGTPTMIINGKTIIGYDARSIEKAVKGMVRPQRRRKSK